ncbi:serine/threonine protein kinase [Frankia casuarinae]|uniref:non-specific serine/threonine protein kinase n=1 Tax=Frankia casuarinae (strain DSM 45818 / CECT 9043 / HFP020203 / CcI3) TaxID=106370 RepID=Q2J6W7_FRACC|nr:MULTISPECIES: serine/threonine-protein kinase [Frankia]ABD12975.1 serine/threonine protein kinase [Frankia casuarinae]EYT93469.1 serine/threonine protein kinase [Frankia casuarinae]KDA43768.1 serine/threonine protein kinase [Frankia sp. BMG5.23]TFE31328.1 serine/threonine protein kinase [Frankia sp. B2]
MRKLGSRYVLHEILGQGTTGQVWRGAAVSDGAPVAIKVLRPELADDPEIVERFLREWDLLIDLDSPDLVAVRDLVNEPDVLAIVMDLVDGPDLRTHLREFGPRPVEEAVRLVVGTLWALDSVHAAGVVHRDVKPENILIDTSDPAHPIVRLTDFGIAQMINGSSRTSVTGPIGTPLYMAPELSTGAPPTPAADVYSAGVVLYELLAGSPPFDSPNPAELLQAHREKQPQPIQGVPAPVWGVLAGMLAKSPRGRPVSAADAAEDLVEALEASRWGGGYASRPGSHAEHDNRIQLSALAGASAARSADHSPATGTQRVVRSAAVAAAGGAGCVVGAGGAVGAAAWSDLEHTQIAGSPLTTTTQAGGTQAGGREGGVERTRMAPATGGRGGWDGDAPTGMQPALRVPARSDAPAADTNTVMSAIPANHQPGPPIGGAAAASRAAADRRRRSRIAAGAGLVVALVAGAGGWALASSGGTGAELSADGPGGVSAAAASGGSGFGTSGAAPGVAVGVNPTSLSGGGATPRPSAKGSPSPGAGTAPAASPTGATPTNSPTARSSPSPSPTDDGTATVPNTEGSSFTTAENTLKSAGFTNLSKAFGCYGAGAVDTVAHQSPKSGKIAKTATINLQVEDCAQVPGVIGMTESDAKWQLTLAGFTSTAVNGSCSNSETSKVSAYSPTGQRPRHSTTVTLTLACTKPPASAPAPTPTSTSTSTART